MREAGRGRRGATGEWVRGFENSSSAALIGDGCVGHIDR